MIWSNISWSTVIASVLGSGVPVGGSITFFGNHFANRWLAHYKAELDREFEAYRDTLERRRKRIEADLGHRTYISKTQFDTEFNAVKECFAALGKLRLHFNALRPMVDWTPDDEKGKLEVLSRRLKRVQEQYNEFIATAESVYPFVPEDIYVQFEVCMKAALLEAKHIESDPSEALTPSGYTEGAKQEERFTKAYFAAARLVRERFRNLSIVWENQQR